MGLSPSSRAHTIVVPPALMMLQQNTPVAVPIENTDPVHSAWGPHLTHRLTLLRSGWHPGGGGNGDGGGGSSGRELGAAVEVVGEVSCAGSLFKGEVRRWRGSEAVVAAGEHRVAQLMALRPLAAVVEWRTGGEAGTG